MATLSALVLPGCLGPAAVPDLADAQTDPVLDAFDLRVAPATEATNATRWFYAQSHATPDGHLSAFTVPIPPGAAFEQFGFHTVRMFAVPLIPPANESTLTQFAILHFSMAPMSFVGVPVHYTGVVSPTYLEVDPAEPDRVLETRPPSLTSLLIDFFVPPGLEELTLVLVGRSQSPAPLSLAFRFAGQNETSASGSVDAAVRAIPQPLEQVPLRAFGSGFRYGWWSGDESRVVRTADIAGHLERRAGLVPAFDSYSFRLDTSIASEAGWGRVFGLMEFGPGDSGTWSLRGSLHGQSLDREEVVARGVVGGGTPQPWFLLAHGGQGPTQAALRVDINRTASQHGPAVTFAHIDIGTDLVALVGYEPG